MPANPNLPVATPLDIVEAWNAGVMQGGMGRLPDYVHTNLRNHPPTIADPIYLDSATHEWRSASVILNPGAMVSVENHLARKGLRVPDATQAAWDETLRRQQEVQTVQTAVEQAIASVDHPRPDAHIYASAVIEALLTLTRVGA